VGGGFALLTGVANGSTNLLVMLSLVSMPASVFFPVMSALSLVLSTLASLLLFKERLLARQLVALLLGCVAVVLIN
jgi:multidrug transporter EmrE-like cation transporter